MAEERLQRVEIPKHVQRYINEELSLYQTYVASIRIMEEEWTDLYDKGRQAGEGGSGFGSGPTENRVIRMTLLEERIKEKHWRVKKIDAVLSLFKGNVEAENIIKAKYFGTYQPTNDEVISAVGLDNYRQKYYDLLNEIQHKFGIVFGVMP